METNENNPQEPVTLTLTFDEASHSALLSVTILEGLMEKYPKEHPVNLPEGPTLEGFLKLKKKLYALDENNPVDVDLDFYMAFALMHAIIQAFYPIKMHLCPPPESKDLFLPKNIEEARQVMDEYGEEVSGILWQLIQKLGYPDYGLQNLEVIFDLKLASRPLQLDKEKQVTTLSINEHNQHLFQWTFTMLDTMEFYQDEYEFARRMYACQYMHTDDYKAISKRLKNCKIGHKLPFTLYDIVALYYAVSLGGRMFASDAAEFYDEVEKKEFGSLPETGVTLKDVRNFFLKFSVVFLNDVKKLNTNNPEFMKAIEVVDTWEV